MPHTIEHELASNRTNVGFADLHVRLPWLRTENNGRKDLTEFAKIHREAGCEEYFSRLAPLLSFIVDVVS